MMFIALQENACPMANVAVIKAVLGKTNENQVMEKTILPGPIADQWAALAMMKKKTANLFQDQYTSFFQINTTPWWLRE